MAFLANLTSEQLEGILKKGLYSDIQAEVTRHLTAEAQARFDAEIKPLIKQKVEEVIRNLVKITNSMYNDPMTGNIQISVNITEAVFPPPLSSPVNK